MKFLLKMVLLASAFLTTTAFSSSKPITSYAQLLQGLNQGNNIVAIVFIDRCTPQNEKMAKPGLEEESSTRVNFNIFSHYKVMVDNQEKFAIATSNTILTEHRAFGPVYAYGRLRIFHDNSAEYHTAYYDAKTFELKGGSDYVCHVSNGSDQNSIMLYDQSV